MIKKIFLILVGCLLICSCDDGKPQYNDWLTGTWEFNNKKEYINFMEDDVFIMNDTIQGSYEIEDEEDVNIFYYYISNTGNTEGYGYMTVEVIERKSLTIANMPMHEGETIKIYRK